MSGQKIGGRVGTSKLGSYAAEEFLSREKKRVNRLPVHFFRATAAAISPSRQCPLGDVGVDLAILRRPRDVLALDERLDPLLDHHRRREESRLQLGGGRR